MGKLKSEVQEEKRYFSDLGSFNWEVYITSNAKIKKGTFLYRARITPDGRKKLKTKEMGCPPKERATAGRANPLGIPYLYLCSKIETTFYEVRAVYLDRISVGKFTILRDLDIVDFSNKISLFYTYSDSESNVSLLDIVKRKILFEKSVLTYLNLYDVLILKLSMSQHNLYVNIANKTVPMVFVLIALFIKKEQILFYLTVQMPSAQAY